MSEFILGEHDIRAIEGNPFSREHRAALANLAEIVMSWQREMDMIRQAVFRLRSEEGGSGSPVIGLLITGSQSIGPNRWKYAFSQATLATDGVTPLFPGTFTGTLSSGWLINMLELTNNGVAPEGQGIPISGAAGSAAEMLPLAGIVPASPFGVGPDGKTIWATWIPNPLKVSCKSTPVIPPTQSAASKSAGVTPQSIIADILSTS